MPLRDSGEDYARRGQVVYGSNGAGFGGGTASYESNLANMYREQSRDFNSNVLPMIGILEDEATSNATVLRAKDRAGILESQVDGVSNRQKQYSQSQMLPSMSKALTTRTQRNSAKMKDSMVSMANRNQVVKHRAARQSLTSIAENLQSTGVAGMAQVTAAKDKRDAAYKAQNRGAMSQIGAVVGGIAGAFMGGPAGASAGASIGGSLGSAVG